LVLALFRVLVPALFWVFHCTMSSRVSTLNVKVDAGGRRVLGDFLALNQHFEFSHARHFMPRTVFAASATAFSAALAKLSLEDPTISMTFCAIFASSGSKYTGTRHG
jgi:hypothetical protein